MKEVTEVKRRSDNKQLMEYTKDQLNHTVALYIMKKYCDEGKISQTAYKDMVKQYEKKLAKTGK